MGVARALSRGTRAPSSRLERSEFICDTLQGGGCGHVCHYVGTNVGCLWSLVCYAVMRSLQAIMSQL